MLVAVDGWVVLRSFCDFILFFESILISALSSSGLPPRVAQVALKAGQRSSALVTWR